MKSCAIIGKLLTCGWCGSRGKLFGSDRAVSELCRIYGISFKATNRGVNPLEVVVEYVSLVAFVTAWYR